MSEPEDAAPKPDTPKNVAPDAVKDPSEKTEGKPGLAPSSGTGQREADPGGS